MDTYHLKVQSSNDYNLPQNLVTSYYAYVCFNLILEHPGSQQSNHTISAAVALPAFVLWTYSVV